MTPAQKRISEAYQEHGTVRGAARALNLAHSTVRKSLQRSGVLKPMAAPQLEPLPDQALSGTSTLMKEGKPVLQWVKTKYDDTVRLEAIHAAIEGMSKRVPAGPVSVPPLDASDEELMVVIPIGDPHIGMLSWAEESGADWDLKIATRTFLEAGQLGIDAAPRATKCLLINLGDYFHTDDQSNQTKRSGHQLDVDSRWPKMFDVGVNIQCGLTDMALSKFDSVHWWDVRGNHDDISSVALSRVIDAYYRNDPRVSVDLTPSLHHVMSWGRCLLGAHHGHAAKKERLAMALATHPEWGGKDFRRVYLGHWHRDSSHEFPGVTLEHINTLAASDAYASGGAFSDMAGGLGRNLKVDTWHKRLGLVNRSIVGIKEIQG